MIRVGIIGLGKFGLQHLRCMSQLEREGRVQLAAICSRTEETLQARRKEFAVETGYTDWRKMLDEVELDAITLVTPDHLHKEMALAALEHGLHVLVEKPLDVTVAGCKEVIAAAEQAGKLLQVDFHKRYDPEHLNMKAAIDEGRLGQVLYGYAHMEDRIEVPSEWFPHWAPYSSPAWFLGVHFYDLFHFLTGYKARSVRALGNKVKLKGDFDVDTYDHVSVQVEYYGGATCAFDASWILPKGFEAIVNQGIRLVGTEGMWECDTQYRGSRSVTTEEGMRTWNNNFLRKEYDKHGHPYYKGYGIESIADFIANVEALQQGVSLSDLKGTYPDGEAGLEATKIAEAAHISLAEDRLVLTSELD